MRLLLLLTRTNFDKKHPKPKYIFVLVHRTAYKKVLTMKAKMKRVGIPNNAIVLNVNFMLNLMFATL